MKICRCGDVHVGIQTWVEMSRCGDVWVWRCVGVKICVSTHDTVLGLTCTKV